MQMPHVTEHCYVRYIGVFAWFPQSPDKNIWQTGKSQHHQILCYHNKHTQLQHGAW